ncbi:N6-adenine methyltransferase [Bodo saltans virus]|uniref:N6-adenine methyltransferase n=1 Tax=Bodo saltans virus TaxID=2024608 RepID=A0A2H4UWA2_9VIRU|nr:N6-adenine methyltransferase [Bodo saltans virus]ATZ81156.1 N6-adenine methyltransferase [Bodo saltans virus]
MNREHKNIIIGKERSMFADGFVERTDLEQYFWTRDTVERLLKALEYTTDCGCLTTPSLGVGFYEIGREETVLDIDKRFNFLPKFKYFDITVPTPQNETYNILILDPPFFYIPMEQIKKAVLVLTKNKTDVNLMIGFLKREEKILLETFKDFDLKPTSFDLEYSTVKPNKWKNYVLYSNIDLPGIKRIHK